VPFGSDALKWNAHRKYGRARLPLLLANWTVVAMVGPAAAEAARLLADPSPHTHVQPVLVLENTRPDPAQPFAWHALGVDGTA
jgi:hypothetical protein